MVKKYGLSKNFHMIGKKPLERMPKLFSYADSMLISLKDDYIFSITIPAKLQSYLACAKPILGMINGETAKIIKEFGAGYVCNSGDYKALANLVLKMSKLDSKKINDLSKKSLECHNKLFNRSQLLEKVEKILINPNNQIG